MPLHKSSRASRLDPTMISAPLGDFRHTMHIGRGGDAFGDTSFLSKHGPASPASVDSISAALTPTGQETAQNHGSTTDVGGNCVDKNDATPSSELQHSESVSSFDLDLDLGPSILGDVLGVMDGLGLDSKWKDGEEDVFTLSRNAEDEVNVAKEWNERKPESVSRAEEEKQRGATEEPPHDSNGSVKSKGLRPKVRFSEKRDEIIGRQDEVVAEGSEVEGEEDVCVSPCTEGRDHSEGPLHGKTQQESEPANHRAESSPSPASSLSSEYEGVSPLDRRRAEQRLSETDSEEEEGVEGQRGYTFEDEFDDEIGL
ncbi:cdc42 effector protein 5 [Chanos chanos]|uniref:Cdc42 effector protein 5 n=1 Tax=Chanos chanos TaxID=29144 RepID=A0A6J2W8H2_CHACN|nr:cdc42 effector protein 5 [Chanos chanos]XP_030640258.1 cdc42 effector protein 5 [Chanos chanos]